MNKPKLIGTAKLLIPPQYGKTILLQKLEINKELIEYIIFHGMNTCQVIFPVTPRGEIILCQQFKNGIACLNGLGTTISKKSPLLLELPGGRLEKNETLKRAATRELFEETGYKSKDLIRLQDRLWYDPAVYTGFCVPWLALGCTKISDRHGDKTETITRKILPIRKWFELIKKGEITDCRSVAISFLALPHLKSANLM